MRWTMWSPFGIAVAVIPLAMLVRLDPPETTCPVSETAPLVLPATTQDGGWLQSIPGRCSLEASLLPEVGSCDLASRLERPAHVTDDERDGPFELIVTDLARPAETHGAGSVTGTGTDWPQIRGPLGTAVAPNTRSLPSQWKADTADAMLDGHVGWRFETAPAAGASSPIVVGPHVFVTWYDADRNDDGTIRIDDQERPINLVRTVAKLTLADGQLVWKQDFPATRDPGAYKGHLAVHGYATNSPAYAEGRVFAFFGPDGLIALDAESGKTVWKADVGNRTSGDGSYTSVTVGNGIVLVNAQQESGSLIALDPATGREIWKRDGLKACRNTPMLTEDTSGPLVILSQKDELLALDAATGEVRWQAPGVEDYVCPSPVADEDFIYAIGGRSNQAFAYAKAADRTDADSASRPITWRLRKGANIPSPIIHEGHLYYVNDRGIVGCVETKTGDVLFEKRLTPAAGRIYASPILADGKIYIATQAGAVYVVAAKPEFDQMAYNPTLDDGELFATPSASGETLLLRTTKGVYALRAKPSEPDEGTNSDAS